MKAVKTLWRRLFLNAHIDDRRHVVEAGDDDSNLADEEGEDKGSDWLPFGSGLLEDAQERDDVVSRYGLQQPRRTWWGVKGQRGLL